MNRRALACLIAIGTTGCARDRLDLPPWPAATRAQQAPEGDLAPGEPIRASINQGKVPADPSMVKASVDSKKPAPKTVIDPPPATLDPSTNRAQLVVDAAPPAKPNMVADGSMGTDGIDVSSSTPNAKPAPVPAAEAQQPSNMGSNLPGSDLGGVEVPSAGSPKKVEVPESPKDKPFNPLTPPSTTAPDAKAPDSDSLAFPTARSIAPGKPVAEIVAKVGDTLITSRELHYIAYDRIGKQGINPAEIPPDQLSGILKTVLADMIDNTMIIQDFRRDLKKPEMWKQFSEAFDKQWHDAELPPLFKKFKVDNELALRKMLESRGESLDDMREAFLLEAMGRELMMAKVRSKVSKPVMIDMQGYYSKHLHEYERPAGIKWREIVLPIEAPISAAAVEQKANDLRKRIRKGEKFDKIARAESVGATAKNGGDWGWSEPGAYGVAQVNAVLKTLGDGKVSEPIVTPRGVYLVKVEGRRTAGPAPFIDVQKEIANKVFAQTLHKEQDAFLNKIRERTVISMYSEQKGRLDIVPPPGKVDDQAQPASLR